MKINCIKPTDYFDLVRTIAQETEIENTGDPDVRVNVWEITDSMVMDMLGTRTVPNSVTQQSEKISKKLKHDLNIPSKHKDVVSGFVENLSANSRMDPEQGTRNQLVALKEVVESVQGEVNKAANAGVDVEQISQNGVIPNLPMPAIAASIGRKLAYQRGLVFLAKDTNGKTAADVERIYYRLGASALLDLEASGHIKLHNDNAGVMTIADYREDGESRRNYAKSFNDLVPAIEVLPESLGLPLTRNGKKNTHLDALLGTVEGRADSLEFTSYMKMADAVTRVTVPSRIVFPSKQRVKYSEEGHPKDVYVPDTAMRQVLSDLSEHPLKMQGDVHQLFQDLYNETRDTDQTASQWLKKFLTDSTALMRLFQIEASNDVASDQLSHVGRNLSKTVPLDDIVEHFDQFASNPDLFMEFFLGRNARMYNTNSVMNPQSSKMARHALTAGEYTVDTSSDAYKFLVSKVAQELGVPAEMLLADKLEGAEGKALQNALTAYEKFKKADDITDRLTALKTVAKNVDLGDFGNTLSTMKALSDIRNGLGKKSIKTEYMVSSDATASGGLITILQAAGSSRSNKIKNLLQGLGVFKADGEQDIEKVSDIYGVLSRALKPFIRGEESDYDISLTDQDQNEEIRGSLKLIMKELFKGDDFRSLSKSPTMTFIYDQAPAGAIKSISEKFAEDLLKKIKKGNIDENTMKLINKVLMRGQNDSLDLKDIGALKKDKELTKSLREGFKNTGVPEFIYSALEQTITNQYLTNHKEVGNRVFNFVESHVKDQQMRVLPAHMVLERKLNGESDRPLSKNFLKSHGIPMSKKYDTLKQVRSDKVITKEEQLAKTVMNVSFVHGIDTATIMKAVEGLNRRFKVGAVLVHDDIRSTPEFVMEAEKQYIQATKDIAMEYDIYEQVLLSAAAYNVELKSNTEYTELLEAVQRRKADRAKMVEEFFNEETDSVIGDGTGYRNIERSSSEGKTEESASTEKGKEKSPAKVQTKLTGILEGMAGDSDIIRDFLNSPLSAKLAKNGKNSFNLKADTVKLTDSATQEIVEHEILHSLTTATIQKWSNDPKSVPAQVDRDIRYINRALVLVNNSKDRLSDSARKRVEYAFSKNSMKENIAEFTSIMLAEKSVAAEVYKKTATGKLKEVLERLMKNIRQILRSPRDQDFSGVEVDAELLQSALNGVLSEGKSYRESNYDRTQELQKEFGETLYANFTPGKALDRSKDYFEQLNASVAQSVNDPVVRNSVRLGKQFHASMDQEFPAYSRAIKRLKGVYDDSETLQSIMHKITNSNIDNKTKNEVLSAFSKIRADKNDLISKQLRRFKAVVRGMSENEMAEYRDFTTKMAIHDYFRLLEGVTDIDEEISKVSSAPGMSSKVRGKLDSIVDMNVTGKADGNTAYNVGQVISSTSELQDQARKYVVLKTIEKLGEDRFKNFLENKELVDLVKDTVLANAALVQQSGIEVNGLRDSGLADQFESPVARRLVAPEDMKFMHNFQKDGWKLARKPEPGEPAILYKTEIDQTYQEGTFTDIRTQSQDIPVTEAFKKYDNVVKVGNEYRYVLTEADREAMGSIKDPSQAIVRTMGHNMAIKESSMVRDRLLQNDTYMNLANSSPASLVDIIKDKDRDSPWLLGASENTNYEDLPAEIRAKYMPVEKQLSDHHSFDKKIRFVRKDINYWLIGSSEKSIARDPRLQWGVRITKDLISGLKIGLVATNPMKIFNDNLSNVAYLGVRGVDPWFMQKQYREISYQFNQYHKVRNELINLKVKSYAEPEKHAEAMKKLEKKLKDHPANGIVERGFLNSLGSELVMNADDPSSGFKEDVDTVLKKVFQDGKGKNNKVGELLMKFSNWNVGLEEFLEPLSEYFGTLNSTKEVEKSIAGIADRWKDIKTEEDAISYMHQYMNSPDSEFVKMGTHMTDLTDVLAKETLYRHLVGNGVSEKDAEVEVIDSFPDYKESMPKRVRQASDVGLIMFPSYWLRIQKTIYRMAKDRPVSFGIETAIQELAGTNAPTILDSNLYSKFTSHYGVFHNPWGNIGAGNIFPTHIF